MSTQYNPYNKLADKHVLIFGATSGLGYAVAKASLAASARVTISSSSTDRIGQTIKRLVNEFPGTESRIQGFACDLSKEIAEDEIEALFSKAGQVDHVVYTAGDQLPIIAFQDITHKKLVEAGQLRFFAPLLVAKVAARYITATPETSYTLTTGGIWERPSENWTMVAGYMGGVVSMARNLALEMKPMRVNVVSPGLVDTEMWDASFSQEQKEGFFKVLAQKHLTGRIGKPEDVAEAYIYLMRDSNATGRVVSSDSGSGIV